MSNIEKFVKLGLGNLETEFASDLCESVVMMVFEKNNYEPKQRKYETDID